MWKSPAWNGALDELERAGSPGTSLECHLIKKSTLRCHSLVDCGAIQIRRRTVPVRTNYRRRMKTADGSGVERERNCGATLAQPLQFSLFARASAGLEVREFN